MKEFLEKLGAVSTDVQNELIRKITKAKDASDVVTIVKEAGISVSNEVAKELLSKVKRKIELGKEGLATVAGGAASDFNGSAPCYLKDFL